MTILFSFFYAFGKYFPSSLKFPQTIYLYRIELHKIFKNSYHSIILYSSETVVQRCSVKKVFLEISQNSQENTCARVSFYWSFFNTLSTLGRRNPHKQRTSHKKTQKAKFPNSIISWNYNINKIKPCIIVPCKGV